MELSVDPGGLALLGLPAAAAAAPPPVHKR
jgi:hypothetical protein